MDQVLVYNLIKMEKWVFKKVLYTNEYVQREIQS